MIFEIFVLAVASTLRPTSLAVVSALLARESSRRLMMAYVVGGLVFAFAFGVVVVGVFHGIHIDAGTERTKAVAQIIGGAAALLFGCAVLVGLVGRRPDASSTESTTSWMSRLDDRITVRVAMLAGPLTHMPGVFYLVALNLIVAHNPKLPGGFLAVAIYDGLWFAVPIAALAMCIVDPDLARRTVLEVAAWTKRHSRTIVLATCFGVGLALLLRGLLGV